jgi:hypothetical protein
MSGQGIVRATELDPFELHDGVWDTLEASLPEAKPTEHPIRLAFAAPHVVMDDAYAAVRHDANQPGTAADITSHIDWESTLDIRTHLADQGLGIAEAMDTAQRTNSFNAPAKQVSTSWRALDVITETMSTRQHC